MKFEVVLMMEDVYPVNKDLNTEINDIPFVFQWKVFAFCEAVFYGWVVRILYLSDQIVKT